MREDMDALKRNSTWEIVRYIWIFTIKHKANGFVDRYKARLVTKGYTQTYGIDYEEAFSPLTKMNVV